MDDISLAFPSHLLLFYHWLHMLLHVPPNAENLLEDTSWHDSEDFLKAVEHAGTFISLLGLLDYSAMPVWMVDATILAVQVHVILIYKLVSFQAAEFQRDVEQKIDAAVVVLDRLGDVRPVAKMLSFGLKLAMTRLARIGTYLEDGEPKRVLRSIAVAHFFAPWP